MNLSRQELTEYRNRRLSGGSGMVLSDDQLDKSLACARRILREGAERWAKGACSYCSGNGFESMVKVFDSGAVRLLDQGAFEFVLRTEFDYRLPDPNPERN